MALIIMILAAVSAASLASYLKMVLATKLNGARIVSGGRRKLPNAVIFNLCAAPIDHASRWFKRLYLGKVREKLRLRFIHAGIDELIGCDQFFAFQLLCGLISVVFSSGAISALVFFMIGAAYPLLWLHLTIKRRKEEILASLPNVADLLTLSVEAGLDLMAALCRVAEGSKHNALIDELHKMLSEMKVGVSRADALRGLSKRCDVPAITSMTALLVQADRLGASVGPVLRAQSDKLRSERFQRAEKAGAAASQKMLFPLVLFMMPAVFIIIFGPIVVQFLTGGLDAFAR